MLEPLDERAAVQRGVHGRRRGARRRWGVIAALVVFIVAMAMLPRWAGRSGDGVPGGPATTGAATTTTGASNVEGR